MGRLCPICAKSVQHVWSHLSRVHKIDGPDRTMLLRQVNQPIQNYVNPQIPEMKQNNNRCSQFHLKHPFTCMVSGMTGCGKTTWVQRLLENKSSTISQVPQRIVWCYSRWQPAYKEMMQTIPEIEFVKGIPHDLEKDSFFDLHMRNLIVIDDQMATASNNKSIINLFTQGSHHRNLSVIYLVQNLFHQGKGNRDISLNCHYLVIFKNPRDQLQILTLAKQMYPRQTEFFLQKYQEAVSRPFGYLFIDLKTSTPDECRLRTNVLPEEHEQTDNLLQNKISDQLIKYLNQQSLLLPPTTTMLQNIQEKMDNVLKKPSLSTDKKVREFIQLQNDFLQYKKKFNTSLPPSTHSFNPSSINTLPTDLITLDTSDEQEILPSGNPGVPEISTQPNSVGPITNLPSTPTVSGLLTPPPSTPRLGQKRPITNLPSTPIVSGLLTPPPSTPRLGQKRPRYDLMKNYLDDDAEKVVGAYKKADRVRRSSRVRKRQFHSY